MRCAFKLQIGQVLQQIAKAHHGDIDVQVCAALGPEKCKTRFEYAEWLVNQLSVHGLKVD